MRLTRSTNSESGDATNSRSPLVVFFIVLTIVSACFHFMAVYYKAGTRNLMWGVALSTFITLFIIKRDLRTLPWRWGAWRYHWIAFGVPFAYCLVAYGVVWIFGFGGFYNSHFVGNVRDQFGLTGWSNAAVLAYFVPTTAFFGLPGSLSSALGEEIGWRGFLVPELFKKMTFTPVALISGIIWGAWHLPLLIGSSYHQHDAAGALPFRWQLPLFFAGVISAAVIAAYLTLKSGSLWPAAIFHGSHNLFVQNLFNPLTIQYPDTAKYIDETGILLPCTMIVFAVVFLIKGSRELVNGSNS